MATSAIRTDCIVTIPRNTRLIGPSLYAQIVQLIGKTEVPHISQFLGGEHYIKQFDAWTHLIVMLYAATKRFDSLREIATSLQSETYKLSHLGAKTMPIKSTLADTNKRRSEAVLKVIYRGLYARS